MSTQLIKTAKDHPYKSALSILTSIATIVLFVWAVEGHYVRAADFSQYQKRQEQFQLQQKEALKSFQRQQLDNQLFDLEFKVQNGTATPLDRAKIERLKRQLQELR